MARVSIDEMILKDTADAIRAKGGDDELMSPTAFAGAIDAIPTTEVTIDKTLTQENQAAEAKATGDRIAAEATARAEADTALQQSIAAETAARTLAVNTEIANRESSDTFLQAQINQIIAPSGEAPSAAEVENARIDVDGVTHATLGEAIRGQVSDLKSATDAADRSVKNAATPMPISLDWEIGTIHATTGNPSSSAKMIRTKYFYPISDTGKLTFTGVKGAGRAHFSYFYDKNHEFIERKDDDTISTNACFVKFVCGFTSSSTENVESYGQDRLIADWNIAYDTPNELEISKMKSAIMEQIVATYVTYVEGYEKDGFTFSTNDSGDLVVYGTGPSSIRTYECFNGAGRIKYSNDQVTLVLDPGVYTLYLSSSGYDTTSNFYLRVSSTTPASGNVYHDGDTFILTEKSGAALSIPANTNLGTSDNPTIFHLGLIRVIAVDPVARSTFYDLYPTGDDTNRSGEIASLCRKGMKTCRLAPGEYYVDTMVIFGRLEGAGINKTTLIYKDANSVELNYAIRLREKASLSNLTLTKYHDQSEVDEDGWITPVEDYSLGQNGIRIEGENDIDHLIVENVRVTNFEGCGLFLRHTGVSPTMGANFVNVWTEHCGAGIYVGELAEFSIFVACRTMYNYTGAVIMGGNHRFVGCDFSSNEVCVAMPDADGYGSSSNDAHGIIDGCGMVHSGNYSVKNEGYTFKIGAQSSTEIISNCIIANGKIDVKDRGYGLQFNGCDFKANVPINIDNSLVFMLSSVVKVETENPVTVVNGGRLFRRNCLSLYGSDLEDVT